MSLDKQGWSSRAQCTCSTMGFENPLWNARYYPDNCPDDWRLAYFMNDFRAVYLLCEDWCESEAQITAIADELEEGFDLVIEWPPLSDAQDVEAILTQLDPLRRNIACIVLNIDGVSAAALDAVARALQKDYTVNLSSKILDTLAQQELAVQYGMGFTWFPALSEAPVSSVHYQVVCLPCQSLRDMKAVLGKLRLTIERNIRTGLFFEPSAQSTDRALEVRTLIELMGFY